MIEPAGCMFTPVNSWAPVALSKVVMATATPGRAPPPSSMHLLLTVTSNATAGPTGVPCWMTIGSG
jgi:hypothetical protein